MKIAHIALWTPDLSRSSAFYQQYFGATVSAPYQNNAKGFSSVFISFADGARIELMHSTQLEPVSLPRGVQRMGLTHLGLDVGSIEAVDALTERLRQDGYEIVGEPRRTGDGFYESIVLDPDGNRLEITG